MSNCSFLNFNTVCMIILYATDTTGQKGLGSSSGNGTIVEGILHDGGNSLISPQEAAAILEQEGSEFMAREVIQLDNGTMLGIKY